MELTRRPFGGVGGEGIPHGAVLHQLPMEVDDTAATRTLVQVVDVLRDDRHTIVLLEAGKQTVPFVGLCSDELPTALIVEVQHALGIAVPAFDAGDLLDVMPRPQTMLSRKVDRPLSALIPAPERTTRCGRWGLWVFIGVRRATAPG